MPIYEYRCPCGHEEDREPRKQIDAKQMLDGALEDFLNE